MTPEQQFEDIERNLRRVAEIFVESRERIAEIKHLTAENAKVVAENASAVSRFDDAAMKRLVEISNRKRNSA